MGCGTMGRSRKVRLLCFLLTVALMMGCANGTASQTLDPNGDHNAQSIGTLMVYAPEKYRPALQQVFSHINLSQTTFRVNWSGDFYTADIVIVDNLPPEEQGNYRVLDPEKLQVQGIEQLTVRSQQGVVGLPLFLQVGGFWYDELLYQTSGIPAPQSMDSWKECPLKGQYPIVCDETDMSALFWTVVAPYYLKNGGSPQELAEGAFQEAYLFAALKTLETMAQSGTIQLQEHAWQSFTANQAAYWITGVDNVAAYYNYQSNRSSWKLSCSLAFDAQERAICVARADVLAVRKDADTVLTDRFLEVFFTQQNLADVSAYSRMPLACRMSYAPGAVPELPQMCYTMLSSPALDMVQVPCLWHTDQQQQVYTLLLSLMNGTLDAAQAANQMHNS